MKIKCIDNKGNVWFKEGKKYRAWKDDYGNILSESELDEAYLVSLNNPHGVFEIVEEEKSHPHADLMLKYALIAQYDDKPWESFEFRNSDTDGWMRVINPCWDIDNEYRLKPQEPKIQAGQVWVSKEGVNTEVTDLVNGMIAVKAVIGGLSMPLVFGASYFLQNFKLKDGKQ